MRDLVFESTRAVSPEEFEEFVFERERAGDIHHFELLNGVVVMTPPAGYPHGSIAASLGAQVGALVYRDQLGRCFDSSQGFRLPHGDVVEPDYAFVGPDRWRAMGTPREGGFLPVVPDLVVEVLSRSTTSRDRGEKKAIYERAGVREYWVLDARTRSVTVFSFRDGRFDSGRVFEVSDRFESIVLPSVDLDLERLFAP